MLEARETELVQEDEPHFRVDALDRGGGCAGKVITSLVSTWRVKHLCGGVSGVVRVPKHECRFPSVRGDHHHLASAMLEGMP